VRPRLAVILSVVLIALVGARASFGPEERIAFLFYDDAYYYLGVARHLAAGDGSTFDGLHATNGYHPLWCAALVPVVAAVRDPGHAVRAVGAIWFLLAAAVPAVAWWALRRRFGDGTAAIASALVALQPWIALSLARPNGLETPLYALLILAAIGAADRILLAAPPPSVARCAALGALLGICVLARLDGGFLAAAVAIVAMVAGGRAWGWRGALARVAALAIAASAIAGPSLVWNEIRFGSPLPISGRAIALEAARERAELGGATSARTAARRIRYAAAEIPASIVRRALLGVPRAGRIASGGAAGLAALAVVVASAIAVGIRARKLRPVAPGDPAAILTLFAALHYAAYAAWLWTPGEDSYRIYYFFPELLAIGVLASVGLARLKPRLAPLGLALLAGHLVVESERSLDRLNAKPGSVADRFIYGWIKANVPPGTVLGARDAGKLGWFSGCPVINLDGLINDDRFLAVLAGGTEGAYVCDSPIRFLFIDRPYLGEFLAGLERTAGCGFRDLDPTTVDWAVLEVERGAR